MSCLPNTPTASNITTAAAANGWVAYDDISTSALLQYYGFKAQVLTFAGVAATTNQHLVLRQLEIEETASSSANIKKPKLLVYLYTDAAPTAPATNAVYNASTTNLLCGPIVVDTADYVRVSNTVWTATENVNRYIRTGTTATATNIYVVAVVNEAVTFAASAGIRVKLTLENHTAL
ncbi:hypothetical protein UFOVP418_10 [uncultured Caudovirales phage]|uniref:Uncharacterized protein n=1 Tax=uncultured Caudovirales phage TaxID=2100421 RepID=A0A6J5M7S2_9CAUD|nr:hypothetical protein UFOVP418_10 [uncultured Caudovirales phage]